MKVNSNLLKTVGWMVFGIAGIVGVAFHILSFSGVITYYHDLYQAGNIGLIVRLSPLLSFILPLIGCVTMAVIGYRRAQAIALTFHDSVK